jgi:excisionase family DNA binding protein
MTASPHAPTASTTQTPTAPAAAMLPGNQLTELVNLVQSLAVQLADIRDTLAAKRKPQYTVDEVADLTGRSAYTVRRWISEGRLKAIRISGTGPKGRLRIAREEIDRLIATGLGANVPDAVTGD